MDWPCTADYCRQFAKALEIPIYFSGKVGGFKREMLREDQLTAPIVFETPKGNQGRCGGIRGKKNTRRKFPQVSANLSVRWCSAYLKIGVGSAAIRNQTRFSGKRTLVITGERAEESAGRAKYKTFEPDTTDNRSGRTRRHVDRWRPVHSWPEKKVWSILKKWKIVVHPAYYLGWGRVSCAACIFGSPNQWASLLYINPKQVHRIASFEKEFGLTIHRTRSVLQNAEKGTKYPETKNASLVAQALGKTYSEPIITDNWALPAGAFGESAGPT